MFRMGGSRGHSHGGNSSVAGALEPDERAPVIVAVKQKLGAFCSQHLAQIRAVDQTPEKTPRRTERRVMDQNDTETSARLLERLGEPPGRSFAKPPRRPQPTPRPAPRGRKQHPPRPRTPHQD